MLVLKKTLPFKKKVMTVFVTVMRMQFWWVEIHLRARADPLAVSASGGELRWNAQAAVWVRVAVCVNRQREEGEASANGNATRWKMKSFNLIDRVDLSFIDQQNRAESQDS